MHYRILSVAFSQYPQDVRVKREAEAVSAAGMIVDVICLKKNNQPFRETINGVNIYRINLQKKREGKFRYILQYVYFIGAAFFKLLYLQSRHRYQIAHVHNMPDVLVFCTVPLRLMGCKVLLDLHDPMPEVFMAKYTIDESNLIIKTLQLFEKYSIRYADLVLTPNRAFRNLFIKRNAQKEKTRIVMNTPDQKIFRLSANAKGDNKFVVMYHGTIVERHGLDIAVEAIALLREKIPKIEFHVYGTGEFESEFKKIIIELNMQNMVKYFGFVPLEKIANAITNIDLGIIPNRKSPFTNLNFPTRIFEYLSLGKPVLVPDTPGIRDYFDEKSIFFFKSAEKNELAEKIYEIYSDPVRRDRILQNGIDVYQKYRWQLQRNYFINLIQGLLSQNRKHKIKTGY